MNLVKEHNVTAALFVNKGTSKVEVRMQRDSFEPHEVLSVSLLVDNKQCEVGVKKYKVNLWREISAISPNGTKFIDKSEMIKRKYEEVIPANDSAQR